MKITPKTEAIQKKVIQITPKVIEMKRQIDPKKTKGSRYA